MVCALGILAVAYGAETTHRHDSDVESAQCVVCHWHDQRIQSPAQTSLEPEPPIRIAFADDAVPVRSRIDLRTLPPATGPPATH